MGKYLIQYSKKAIRDLQMIKKSGRKSDRTRIDLFLLEMEESPRMGSGSPEQLNILTVKFGVGRSIRKIALFMKFLKKRLLSL
ncbi:toxin YoeB [Sphingobacterium sp. HSC-15S19]